MDSKNLVEEINRQELPFKSWILMAWAMFWRGSIITLGSIISGGLIGFVLGFLGIFLNVPIIIMKISSYVAGAVIGFLFLTILLKWFFKTNFKNFRIAILKKNS